MHCSIFIIVDNANKIFYQVFSSLILRGNIIGTFRKGFGYHIGLMRTLPFLSESYMGFPFLLRAFSLFVPIKTFVG